MSIPPQVLAQYQAVNQRATTTAATPFKDYTGKFVAGINGEQEAGMLGTQEGANAAQPYYGQATDTLNAAQAGTTGVNDAALAGTSASSSPLTGSQIEQYLSPYLGTVLGSESALLNQNNQQQQAGQLGTAIQSGAFGSDRTGIAAANLEQQQNLANANIYGNILNQGYQSALSTAQGQQQIGLAGAQQLANIGQMQYGEGANTANTLAGLGTAAQSAALQGAQAEIGAGTLQQQTQQAQDAALYNQFEQQQSYPFQVDQFLANIAEGTGALSGSTTTTTQPGGFFSDERLKDNVTPIGKTFDNQNIYSYSMKGDPRTRIGLLAQEVEQKHPEAVGLAGGYKTVNYGKATAEAANEPNVGTPKTREEGIQRAKAGLAGIGRLMGSTTTTTTPGGLGAAVPEIHQARIRALHGELNQILAQPPSPARSAKIRALRDRVQRAASLLPSSGVNFEQGGRVGKAGGGGMDSSDIAAILQMQQAMYGNTPYATMRSINGAPHGGVANIPQSAGGNYQLHPAESQLKQQPTGLQNTAALAGLAQSGQNLYNNYKKSQPAPTGSASTASPPTGDPNYQLTPITTTAQYMPDPTVGTTTDFAPQARGGLVGRHGYDLGGSSNPYQTEGASGTLDIPNDPSQQKLAVAQGSPSGGGGGGGSSSTMNDIKDVAEIAGVIAEFVKRGGRIGKDSGGSIYDDNLSIPNDPSERSLATAPGLSNGNQQSGLSQIASLAGSFEASDGEKRGGRVRRGLAAGGDPGDPDPDFDAVADAAATQGDTAAQEYEQNTPINKYRLGTPTGVGPTGRSEDMTNPQAVGLGKINRDGGNLVYTRDPSSQMPFSAPWSPNDMREAGTASTGTPAPSSPPSVQAALQRFASSAEAGLSRAAAALGIGSRAHPETDPRLRASPAHTATPASGGPGGTAQAGQPLPPNSGISANPTDSLPTEWNGYQGLEGIRPGYVPDSRPPQQAGLGAAQSQQIANAASDPHKSLWDRIKEPENLIPLLTAIGVMGTTPTRHLGVALASGLTAGAQAYLPTQQQQANIAQTKATTAQTQAQASRIQQVTMDDISRAMGYGNAVAQLDPNGKYQTPDGRRWSLVQKGSLQPGAGATGGAPTYKMIGPVGQQVAAQAANKYNSMVWEHPEQEKQQQDQAQQIQDAGLQARENLLATQRWESSMAHNQDILSPGSGSDFRAHAVSMLNTALRAVGHPEMQVKEGDLEAAQMAAKTSTGIAALHEAEGNQRSFGALKAFLQATPNTQMQRGAALNLMADEHIQNQEAIDKMNYLQEVDKENQRVNGVPPRRYLPGDTLVNGYNQEFREGDYERDRNNFAAILQAKSYPAVMNVLQNGTPEQKQQKYDELDAAYGRNFHRYFTGTP